MFIDPSPLQTASCSIPKQHFSPHSIPPPLQNIQQAAPTSSNVARSGGSISSTYTQSPQTHNTVPLSPCFPQPSSTSPIISYGQRQSSTGQQALPSRSPAGGEALDHGPSPRQSGHPVNDQRQLHYDLERTPSVHSLYNKPMQTLSPYQNGHEERFPVYASPPKNISAICPLDGLLLKFLSDQRERVLQGVQAQEIIGPPYPSFRALVDPQTSDTSHPLSKVFTDMLGKFPDISRLPEQAAIL